MTEEINRGTDSFNQDFTTATRWEVFCARLEEIIHDWKLSFKKQSVQKLPLNALSTGEWETKEELVTYDGMELKVTLYTVKFPSDSNKSESLSPESMRRMSVDMEKSASEKSLVLTINSECQAFLDLMSLENNWCILDEKSNINIHPLARWYGLREFIVISTCDGATVDENKRRNLRSSINLAIGANISTPIFVQALKSQQNVYSGIRIVIFEDAFEIKNKFSFLQVFVSMKIHESLSILFIYLKRIHRASFYPELSICLKKKFHMNIKTQQRCPYDLLTI